MKKIIITLSIILFTTTINAQQVYVEVVDTIEAITENCTSIIYNVNPPIIKTTCDTIGYDSVKIYKLYYLETKEHTLQVKSENCFETIYKYRENLYYYDTIYIK